jgi:hypothetical protein
MTPVAALEFVFVFAHPAKSNTVDFRARQRGER